MGRIILSLNARRASVRTSIAPPGSEKLLELDVLISEEEEDGR